MSAPAAIEDTGNICWSPMGTLARHYRLAVPVTYRKVSYRSVVVVAGITHGHGYVYASDEGGEIADWWTMATVTAGG